MKKGTARIHWDCQARLHYMRLSERRMTFDESNILFPSLIKKTIKKSIIRQWSSDHQLRR